MKKLIGLIMAFTMLFSMTICQAAEVPVNDELTPDTFADAFNQTSASEGYNYSIAKDEIRTEHNSSKNLDIYFFNPTENSLGNPNTLIFIQCDSEGKIHEVDLFTPVNGDKQASFRELGMYVLLTERTLGMPDGEGHSDGMFALLDAFKSGKGSYWSSKTNRRYVVLPNGDTNTIGCIIYATV